MSRHVVITGASRGIGAAAVAGFVKAGDRVSMLARTVADLAAIKAEIGDSVAAIACDMSDLASVRAALAQAIAFGGPVDVLVNNAGQVAPIGAFRDVTAEDFAAAVAVNLTGVYALTHGVLASMPKGGVILNISSGAAHGPVEGWSAYCASKAGARMLTRMLALEEGPNGITTIGLSPGTVATQMQRDIKASGINPVSALPWDAHIPPEWVGAALVWLAGPAGAAHAGEDVSLRDPGIRKAIGLIP